MVNSLHVCAKNHFCFVCILRTHLLIIMNYNTAEKGFPLFPLCREPVCNMHMSLFLATIPCDNIDQKHDKSVR